MKKLPFILTACLLAGTHPGHAATTAELRFGAEAMTNLGQLPLLFPNGTRTRQPLAYDASGGNYDHHFLAAFAQASRR